MIDHPKWYNVNKNFEVIEVIYAWKVPYPLDNVIKYIARHEYKGAPLEDLKKAQWYLNWYIEKLECEKNEKK